MPDLFHLPAALSTLAASILMGAARAAGALAIIAVPAAVLAATPASGPAPVQSEWYGRWTVNEENPVFTARGRLYRTVDIAPCGKDFCGVSVGDKGVCGPVLFRFLGWRARAERELRGHGVWGKARKNVMLMRYDTYAPDSDRVAGQEVELYLGDGWDFGGRSDSMPKFHATYKRMAGPVCRVG
jgi:hypothetical protein